MRTVASATDVPEIPGTLPNATNGDGAAPKEPEGSWLEPAPSPPARSSVLSFLSGRASGQVRAPPSLAALAKLGKKKATIEKQGTVDLSQLKPELRAIQLPAATPATVPVQQRSRTEAECTNSVIRTSGLYWS